MLRPNTSGSLPPRFLLVEKQLATAKTDSRTGDNFTPKQSKQLRVQAPVKISFTDRTLWKEMIFHMNWLVKDHLIDMLILVICVHVNIATVFYVAP